MVEFGTFKDKRDGYEYRTVKIGKQTWLAENFRFDCAGSKVYENDEANLEIYGRLYTWYSAINASPDGWRLPSKEDWNELIKSVGGEDVAGKVLKAKTGWKKDGNGTDEFGFCALPGGYGFSGGSFSRVGSDCFLWSASEYDRNYAYYRGVSYLDVGANWPSSGKSNLFSVRLIVN